MTDRNLPPGCSTADGGIDHALDAAAPALELLREYVAEAARKSNLRIYRPKGLASAEAALPAPCEIEYACAFVDELLKDPEALATIAAYARLRAPLPVEAVSLDARASTLLAAVLHWAKGEIIIAPHEIAELDVNAHVEITHEETGALRLRLGPRS